MNIPAVVTSADLKHGARVLLRSSLNVPVVDGRVTSTFRIEQALRTIQHLVQRGARVTVISHLGREGQSLAPVHAELSKHIPASFIPEVTGDRVYAVFQKSETGRSHRRHDYGVRHDPGLEGRGLVRFDDI